MKQYKVINGKVECVDIQIPSINNARPVYTMTDDAKQAIKDTDTRDSIGKAFEDNATHNNVMHGVRAKLQAASAANPDKIMPLRNALERDISRALSDTTDILSDSMDIYMDAWLAAAEFDADETRTIEHKDGTTSRVNAQYDAAKKATDKAIRAHRAIVSKAIRTEDEHADTVYPCIVTQKDGTQTIIPGYTVTRKAKTHLPLVYVPVYQERKDADTGETVTDTDGKPVYDCIDTQYNRFNIEDDYTLFFVLDVIEHADISDRQKKIVKWLLQGLTQANIAHKLSVSQAAVAKNLATIRKRMEYLLSVDNADKLLTEKRTENTMTFHGAERLPHIGIMPHVDTLPFTHDIVSALAAQSCNLPRVDESSLLNAWLACPAFHHVSITADGKTGHLLRRNAGQHEDAHDAICAWYAENGIGAFAKK